jgi:transcriptional regulator with XRE-family HTH domain
MAKKVNKACKPAPSGSTGNRSFAAKVRAAAAARDKSLIGVADEAHMPRPTLQSWLHQGKMPAMNAGVGVARVLNVPPRYLVDESIPPEPVPQSDAACCSDTALAEEIGRRFLIRRDRLFELVQLVQKRDYAEPSMLVMSPDKKAVKTTRGQLAELLRVSVEIGAEPGHLLNPHFLFAPYTHRFATQARFTADHYKTLALAVTTLLTYEVNHNEGFVLFHDAAVMAYFREANRLGVRGDEVPLITVLNMGRIMIPHESVIQAVIDSFNIDFIAVEDDGDGADGDS